MGEAVCSSTQVMDTMRITVAFLTIIVGVSAVSAQEQLPHTVWLEAETFGPLHGANFSFQPVERTTKGSWSLSGPGVAAEWMQGGESEFMSVAARADEPGEIVIGRDAEIPAGGQYSLWVRYVDYRGKKQSFGVRMRQGKETFSHVFGESPVVDDLDQMKLMWDSALGWDHVPVDLKKGAAHIELFTTGPTEARRQVDCLCLTTDPSYHPGGREKPDTAAWRMLRAMRDSGMAPVESLRGKGIAGVKEPWPLPAEWKSPPGPPVFLWNTGQQWYDELKKKPGERVEWPFAFDSALLKQFLADFRGKEMPVYGDTLSGPAIHIAEYPRQFTSGSLLSDWLDLHPQRSLAVLLNYGSPAWPKKDTDRPAIHENLKKLGDRFIGFIAGENIAYADVDQQSLDGRIRAATSRADVLAALREANTQATIKKFSDYFGKPVSAEEAWAKVIPCLSASNEAFAHALADWGVKRIGHESTGNSPTLARRLAFLRGAARQFGAGIVDYQSCNFGDASTIFSREGLTYPATSRFILDNQYDAWAGSGMNWVLKDYLLFHIAGADAFYHEEGNDIFWKPGGNSAGDGFPIGLSPRGRVTEAVMNIARLHPRGSQFTPIAFLLDEAHGWTQEAFQPGSFGLDPSLNPDVLSPGKHQASIRGWFDVAYFPAPETQNEPSSAIRQTFVNGIFGDIFDVIVTAPKHTQIASTYPVLIAAGNVTVSREWGEALKRYIESGGTLVVCDGQFAGPGIAALGLPTGGEEAEASSFLWKTTGQTVASNVFRFRALPAEGGHVLATADGKTIALALDRGRGRLIVVSVSMGLGIDERPIPVLPVLLRHLTTDLLPIRVTGDVEWAVNRLENGNWLLTLLNNRGVIKPQHGMLPTDYHEAQTVRVDTLFGTRGSTQWIGHDRVDWNPLPAGATTTIVVPAGGVRMLEIQAQ